jgi:ornithine cyclodeaminase/alanine dehydrogenase-like protein (mu-crystallin family)
VRQTLILSRKDIAGLLRPADYREAVEVAFRAFKERRAELPPPLHLGCPDGAFHAKGATLLGDRHYAALKLNGNFPGNSSRNRLPTIQGAVFLCDGSDGSLLAVLDSIEITLGRTAAASVLAARYLARSDARTILVCGCGDQGRAHARAFNEALPLRRLIAWDKDFAKAQGFAREMGEALQLESRAVSELREGSLVSDVIVTCTTSRTPILGPSDVASGAFVAAVGADSPNKNEIAPALMANAIVVADVHQQCITMGDLKHAIDAGVMSADDVHADLGDLVTERKNGRNRPDEITIFDSTGTALQDVASAAIAFERAAESGIGTAFDFSAS